jgi:dolichol-phosphate mannosyltransferase
VTGNLDLGYTESLAASLAALSAQESRASGNTANPSLNTIELAVIIPTFNESQNIEPLLALLDSALRGLQWEVIFVDDDSTDNTSRLVRSLSAARPNVRVLQRIGRRGLSSACIEGMLATSAAYLAVMDADLQHDETLLPRMLETIKAEKLDLVIGSRSVEGGSMGEFAARRQFLSNMGRKLSTAVCKVEVLDPMSGFMMLDRRFFEEVDHRLSGISFKILVDLLASSTRPVRIRELPYTFRNRIHGESKLDTTNLLEFLFLLADKSVGRYIPIRYAMFALSGLCGAVLHFLVLWFLFYVRHVPFNGAEASAALSAMALNFFVNNATTYRQQRLKGFDIVTGLFWFLAACSVGGVTSVAIASFGYQAGFPALLAGLVGLMIGSVWNYAVTSLFTWKQSLRK